MSREVTFSLRVRFEISNKGIKQQCNHEGKNTLIYVQGAIYPRMITYHRRKVLLILSC